MAKKKRHVSERAAVLAHAAMNHSEVPAELVAQAEALAVQPVTIDQVITEVIEESTVAVVETVETVGTVETAAEPTTPTEVLDAVLPVEAPEQQAADQVSAFAAAMADIEAAQAESMTTPSEAAPVETVTPTEVVEPVPAEQPAPPVNMVSVSEQVLMELIAIAKGVVTGQVQVPAAEVRKPDPKAVDPHKRVFRGKSAITGAPTREDLPEIKAGLKSTAGHLFDSYIKDLMDGGFMKEAEAVGNLYNRLVHGNWIAIPEDARLVG